MSDIHISARELSSLLRLRYQAERAQADNYHYELLRTLAGKRKTTLPLRRQWARLQERHDELVNIANLVTARLLDGDETMLRVLSEKAKTIEATLAKKRPLLQNDIEE